MNILDEILRSRGYTTTAAREAFLSPDYEAEKHDAFLLPDMERAVGRLVQARDRHEAVVVYGDYDIDGLTASTVLLEAFEKFGISARVFIPNRFVEGYGLSAAALEMLAKEGTQLVVTVDCGSLSHKEIDRANELGLDVIVTDHHAVADTMPSAVAVINPKRTGHVYPFTDLAGAGVAFKLVQALQQRVDGLPVGQEKWLLDLVALGTVCDVVELTGENRANVFWGLEVMKKTRRPGLLMLLMVAHIESGTLTARSLGFGIGPRLNASGRLETAQIALDLLTATDRKTALTLAEQLDAMNSERRRMQDKIFMAASKQAEQLIHDPVLVVSHADWSHGIIGIVAAKLLERYRKPTFVLQELRDGTSKGSARSFGDFSAVLAIRATDKYLIKGGGHTFAAGVTLATQQIDAWRGAVNEYYKQLQLADQTRYLLAKADITLDHLSDVNEGLFRELQRLEPFGNGNPVPVLHLPYCQVVERRLLGTDGRHVSYVITDKGGVALRLVAWNAAQDFVTEPGEDAAVWFEVTMNEWQGRRNVEGKLLRLEGREA